jgi:NADH-ubiquinone oxidoreductase chain 6
MNAILLDLLAFGSVLSGILVITSRNPIISVLFLIAVFVNVACYLILFGINFIGWKAKIFINIY